MFLRQSTAQAVNFGPFLDATNGNDEETALTIAQADMRLSKDGGAYAQKSAAGNATHDADGNYTTTLSTTDTDTVGELKLYVHVTGALAVWEKWYVVEEAIYDKLFASSAALNDLSASQVNAEVDTALADYDAPTKAEMDSGFAALNDLDAAGIRAAVGLAANNLDAQLGVIDGNVDDIELAIAALNDLSFADIFTTAMTESYHANGAQMSLAQAMYTTVQWLLERSQSGTTITVRQRNGTTTAYTQTADDATNPTEISRTT